MNTRPSPLHQWFDRDFHEMGAFLTTSDNEFVYFAKGGETQSVDKFLSTNRSVFYLKNFYSNTYEAYIPGEVLKISRAEVQDFIKCWDFNPVTYPALENDEDIYKRDFKELMEAFKGDVKKAVLISRESYDGPLSILKLMKSAFDFGTGIPYGFWNETYGIIGSTPELLFDVKNDLLSTYALAGTARLGEEDDLLNSAKDRHEHNLVIRDIEEKLAGFSSNITTSETGIHKFKNIIHLRTNIKAEVHPKLDYTDLTNLFSPTAALGGYPKKQSMEFLSQTEYAKKYSKRFFGSAFGLMTPETKQFIVAIRNVQWKDHKLFIECGGGVVPESILEKEIEEIHLKRNTIRKHYL
jgi:menaquinone-specific isochorismate synthase